MLNYGFDEVMHMNIMDFFYIVSIYRDQSDKAKAKHQKLMAAYQRNKK